MCRFCCALCNCLTGYHLLLVSILQQLLFYEIFDASAGCGGLRLRTNGFWRRRGGQRRPEAATRASRHHVILTSKAAGRAVQTVVRQLFKQHILR